jgi:DNA-binding Lrp family transcriptional regulator
MLRTTYFMPWQAHSGTGPRKHFEYRHDSEKVFVDSVDLKILDHLKRDPVASLREISRSVGIPTSTVSFRFQKLVSNGVILGFGCDYDPMAAGSEHYLILIKLHGLGGGLYERFFEFAAYHPRIARVTRMIGEWDLEMELELENTRELNDVIHQVYKHGAGCVRQVLAHTWGVEHRFRSSNAVAS